MLGRRQQAGHLPLEAVSSGGGCVLLSYLCGVALNPVAPLRSQQVGEDGLAEVTDI